MHFPKFKTKPGLDYISKKIGDRTVVWVKTTNKYLFMQNAAFEVFVLFKGGLNNKEIATWYSYKNNIPKVECYKIVKDITSNISDIFTVKTKKEESNYPDSVTLPDGFLSVKYYKIFKCIISLTFGCESLENVFHPLFRHLEIQPNKNAGNYFLFYIDGTIHLSEENRLVGCWGKHEVHLVKGRLFMEILNRTYNKTDKCWMATLHASSVTNGSDSIILQGSSGSGKSTLAAILKKNKLHILADDFVPIDCPNGNVYNLPTSISVKPSAVKVLMDFYPHLKKDKDSSPKEVKLFPEKILYNKNGFPVKAIIFIEYQEHCQFEFQAIPQDKALEMLIPDTWISNYAENIYALFNWIEKITCYKIKYSNIKHVIEKILDLYH